MFHYSIVFFVVALIAAFFGYSGVAAGAADIARLLFYGFAVLTGVSVLTGMVRGKNKVV